MSSVKRNESEPREIFVSAVRAKGDFAGVFEYSDGAAFFYLYRVSAALGNKVLDALKVATGVVPFLERDVSVEWFDNESLVTLQIHGITWAIFGCDESLKLGEQYSEGAEPVWPREIASRLAR